MSLVTRTTMTITSHPPDATTGPNISDEDSNRAEVMARVKTITTKVQGAAQATETTMGTATIAMGTAIASRARIHAHSRGMETIPGDNAEQTDSMMSLGILIKAPPTKITLTEAIGTTPDRKIDPIKARITTCKVPMPPKATIPRQILNKGRTMSPKDRVS